MHAHTPSSSASFLARGLAIATLAAAALGSAHAAGPGQGGPRWTYEVTITNLTYNQQFTPVLLATHQSDIAFLTPGQPASPQLKVLAEEGNVAPLRAVLDGSSSTTATTAGNSLTGPGQSVTFRIQGNPLRDRLSLAAMLIPTNDAFVALDAVALPIPGRASTYVARAYDAGTEVNDELCSSIPGPMFAECGGPGGGAQVNGGEGFVHVHRGFHGIGHFMPSSRDWRNPVAEVVVRHVH